MRGVAASGNVRTVDGRPEGDGDGSDADATRRTWFALERTLLAWWRSALAAFAVSLGVGRLVPALLDSTGRPFVGLGIGYSLLGLGMVVVALIRYRAADRDLRAGRTSPLSPSVGLVFTVLFLALGIGTMVLILFAL
jgi:putative membrane protein